MDPVLEEKMHVLNEGFLRSGYEVICEAKETFDAMVTMRDGVRLHTYISLPEAGEVHPVIVTRSCYPHLEYKYRIYAREFAKRGFGFVWQYCRGREESEGDFVPNLQERNDSLDTVEWLLSQPWCGKIGYYGHSYTAMIGWSMADKAEGKVASMFLEEYGTDRFASVYQKGAFRHDIITAWSMENGSKPITATNALYIKSCLYRPQTEVDVALWGEKNETYRQYVTSPHESDELWQTGWWKQLREIPGKTTIPVCIMSGWYDHHHGSSRLTWERLSKEAKQHSRFLVGGWNHSLRTCMPGRTTDHADVSDIPRVLAWFDQTLRRTDAPVEPGVSYYVIGADRWLSEEPETIERVYYPDVTWGDEFSYGMSTVASDVMGAVSYRYNPGDPVLSVGGDSLFKTKEQIGSLPVGLAGERADVISFATEPLMSPMTICGKMQVKLRIKSDAFDTAFTAKLIEETKEGEAYHIRSSITTILSDDTEERPYAPGLETMVTIDLWDICYELAEGSRLRLDISSSNFPEYHIHGNVAEPWAETSKQKIAKQTILTGGSEGTRLIVPVLV